VNAPLQHLFLLCLLSHAVVGSGRGQAAPQPMYASGVAMDASCAWDSNDQNCTTGASAGCSMVTVIVQSTGHYYLHTWVDCAPGDPHCGGCYACAHLVRASDGVTFISPCHTQLNCDQQSSSCEATCPGSPGATLVAGVEYKLWVCKRPCSASDCRGCNTDCAAKAQITG
jgi:hypothetical protein